MTDSIDVDGNLVVLIYIDVCCTDRVALFTIVVQAKIHSTPCIAYHPTRAPAQTFISSSAKFPACHRVVWMVVV